MPHLDAAHNLARWMTRSDQDAQDVVQEAYLRAFRFFDSYQGGDGKAFDDVTGSHCVVVSYQTVARLRCRPRVARLVKRLARMPLTVALRP